MNLLSSPWAIFTRISNHLYCGNTPPFPTYDSADAGRVQSSFLRHTGGGDYKAEVGVRGDPVPTGGHRNEVAAASLCNKKLKEKKEQMREEKEKIREKMIWIRSANNMWTLYLLCMHDSKGGAMLTDILSDGVAT